MRQRILLRSRMLAAALPMLAAGLLLGAPRAALAGAAAPKRATGLLRRQTLREPKLDYWLYVPARYNAADRYGLVVVLHPAGLRGSHHTRQWGVLAERVGKLIVLGPECRDRKRRSWKMGDEALVLGIVRQVMVEYNVDPRRVLLAGFSLGGNYAYKFGLRNPGVFRAIAPFSGALLARPSPAADAILQRAKGVAVYIVHGAKDSRIPVEHARASRAHLERFGYQIVYRELPNLGHQFAPREAFRVLRWFNDLPAPSPPSEAPPPKAKE